MVCDVGGERGGCVEEGRRQGAGGRQLEELEDKDFKALFTTSLH